ncbi:hypothetical protein MNBD_BACTEROID01-263 [hydrothermal vent metagenome]|uniref:Uncharacterized protein n=1 Tax=hydrothermal vent metagenome TaxID=652676 RepID=A0A3B0TKI8_9ZZZZ
MKTIKYFAGLLLLSVTLTFFSCEDVVVVGQNDSDILFQFEYVNHAWGENHRGFFVVPNGDILSYNLPEGWIFPVGDSISASALQNNLLLATDTIGHVDAVTLNQMAGYVGEVFAGKLTEPKNLMADAGSEGYFVYRWDQDSNVYKRATLLIRGDFYQENNSPGAKIIAGWLIGLNDGGMFNEEK